MQNNNPFLELRNGNRQAYDENDNMTKLYFESCVIELISEKSAATSNEKSDFNEYYIGELFTLDNNLPSLKRNKLMAEGHQRLIWPLYNFILTFLGLSVFLRQPYNRRSHAKPIIISVLSLVAVVFLHFTFQNLLSRNLSFVFASYANFFVACLVSMWFYKQKVI